MFKRLKRIIDSFMNGALEATENPELILKNNIREMKNHIPKLNEGVIKANAAVLLLKEEIAKYINEEQLIIQKLKASAEAKEDAIGVHFATQLKNIRESKVKAVAALEVAQKGLQAMKDIRETQLSKIRNEVEKIKSTIKDAQVAKLKGEIAGLFQSYETNDIAGSNEDMIEKIRQQTAENDSKFIDMGNGFDVKLLKVEQKAQEAEAKELYQSFKKEFKIK